MAEYYTQWSVNLDINSEEEYAWLQGVLNLDPGSFTNPDEERDSDQYIEDVKSNFGFELIEDDFDWAFPGFEYDLAKGSLWAYAEEDGNLDTLGRIVQAFFRKFRPDGFFYVTWANTCSKMRVDEFNGGAMVVTAEKIKLFNVTDFVREQEKLHNQKFNKA